MMWKELSFIAIGWFLGIASHLTIVWIQRKTTDRRFRKTLLVELGELEWRLSGLAFTLTLRYGDFDRGFIAWYSQKIRAYDGPNICSDEIELLRKLEMIGDADLAEYQRIDRARGLDKSLKHHRLPFLASQMHMLAGSSLRAQSEVIKILASLDIINEEIDLADFHFKRTLDSSRTPEDHQVITENLNMGYKAIAGMAQTLADHINDAKCTLG